MNHVYRGLYALVFWGFFTGVLLVYVFCYNIYSLTKFRLLQAYTPVLDRAMPKLCWDVDRLGLGYTPTPIAGRTHWEFRCMEVWTIGWWNRRAGIVHNEDQHTVKQFQDIEIFCPKRSRLRSTQNWRVSVQSMAVKFLWSFRRWWCMHAAGLLPISQPTR